MIEIADLLRNLYGASGGAIPAAAWTATAAALLWLASYDDALQEMEMREAFAERLRWSDEQFDLFWTETSSQFTPDGTRKFDEGSDPWDDLRSRMSNP